MLRRFAVENFRNFKNRTEVDFTAVHNYTFSSHCVKNGILNKAILLGKNGSGKTNLGFALFDIVMTLTDSTINLRQTDPGAYLNGDSTSKEAAFEYEFQQGEHILKYAYRKIDPRTIVYEELSVDGAMVYRREGDKSDYEGLARYGADRLRMNVSNGPLAILRYVYANTVQSNDSPISFIMDFVSHMLYFKTDMGGNTFIGYGKGESIFDYIVNNGLTDDFRRTLNDVAGIDSNLDVARLSDSVGIVVQKFKNKQIRFETIASSGTIAFALFYYWYKHMADVTFLYMDEFDAFYHYEMSERIVRLVSEMGGFQTVFTTHNISLLRNDLLRPDCCLVLDSGVVRSFSDSTDRELRQGHNLEKLYRNGEFDE